MAVKPEPDVKEEEVEVKAEDGEEDSSAPDSYIDHAASITYWNSISPDVRCTTGAMGKAMTCTDTTPG